MPVLCYMLRLLPLQAPEMLLGERCSEKVDIYSMGIVLWELVTGDVPQRGRVRPLQCVPLF